MENRIISADSHMDLFYIPADSFTSHTTGPMKEKVPKVVEMDGRPMWVSDGVILGGHGAWHGRKEMTDYRGKRMSEVGWDPTQCRPSNPKLRIEDQELDGVQAEVIYGLRFIEDSIKRPDLITATYRAFNDFMAEFCSVNPNRLIGVANIPAHSADSAAEEIRRIGKRGLGLKGGLFDFFNSPKPIWDSMWEPMWSAAEENQVVLSFHIAAGHGTTMVGSPRPEDRLSLSVHPISKAAGQAVTAMQADECLASIILCGALERHPGLKVVMAESGIGWIPYLLDRMDGKFEEGTYTKLIKTKPSDLFRRQMWATFANDKVGARLAEEYAPDNFCWASDYPHLDGVWPDSQEFIKETMGSLNEELKKHLIHDNVARLYKLN